MRLVFVLLLAALALDRVDAAVTLANVAAATTIAVNVLEIKAHWARVKVVVKATKRVAVRVARKAVGR